MQRGDIVEFKRRGFTSWFLGGLLKLMDRKWDGWGWHLAIAVEYTTQGWCLLEAVSPTVALNVYDSTWLAHNTRSWHWFKEPPAPDAVQDFIIKIQGKRYDVAQYFWTAFAIIIRHYFNRPIPKLLDERFTCWELAQEFTADMGEPILSKYDVVIITDMIKALKERRQEDINA